ncbi:MAG: SMC-Scp complex subunit ScpB [Nitrospinae bacterium RIFCSPLOWO2_02_FULL_39_110]|nr:MAG: SMC-Scp complex subunit ScpB [Nitrospinae bacterium RIFCSPHIGHO2_02_39_11]OGV99775.1 MAG: SMC-Scp complex subunit ScpB [Nitrospinae bacterium RIFCSPHIGHO2_12_FULL_39_42]OGW01594.1 MAG: SMC-Scp complex subunit ScpB [Nitrospinae bacterium RIFCSPHIGHO2_02_FULL_39_82]OGW02215.1 MAG: SMC-Scp complex subunit ScpB [Nitrospinae bacterium RIFCSPLOWO2_02_39_17]OGW06015.1 MAG: SMC-Scp complex subunit ScpB [Nitrospinae bacterium RIFCSPLOWO2_02_FULL_39_110]OGW11265.1 MAG: SMC-Scp complex subunit Sc
MDLNTAKSVIENILFIADRPLSLEKIGEVFGGEIDRITLKRIMDELKTEYQDGNIQFVEIAEGYQLCTRPEYSEWIKKFYTIDRGSRLSRPSLETLSIIAYRQPITRTEIEEIRGVDSGGVIRTLLEKSLIRNMGRKKVPGRPMMYGTARKFLEYFGLKNLSDLPTLEEFKEEDLKGGGGIEAEGIQDELKFHEKVSSEGGEFKETGISSESDEIEDIEGERDKND